MYKLSEDLPLLENMINIMKKEKSIYQPGLYWLKKTKTAYKNIKKFGIQDFRGTTTTIGESYTDSILLDIRVSYINSSNIFKKIFALILKYIPIINTTFDKQLNISIKLQQDKNELIKFILQNESRTNLLLTKYKIPFSTLGGCIEKVELGKIIYSTHYLNMLDQHDYLTDYIDFKSINSLFEIGGGFGLNLHLIIENYPNIKKIIYLDIPPNLYVGTQYLKSFYADSIIDFSKTSSLNKIEFGDNNELEIYCIAPWQIENLVAQVDLFYNSHSFVEMPIDIVKNYVNILYKNNLNANTKIALISYSNYDSKTTFNPNILKNIFNEQKDWVTFTKPSLIGTREANLFFISNF